MKKFFGGKPINDVTSRAALSLLGFCYYHIQDFSNAAECYEQLTQLHPEVEEYKVYYAQSLYKSGAYPEATKASFALDNTDSHIKMVKLQASVKYCEEDYSAAKVTNFYDTTSNPVKNKDHFKGPVPAGSFIFLLMSFMSVLIYNIALTFYSQKNYPQALKYITMIIEKGIQDHPELSIGMKTEGIDMHSVGNTLVLHESALIEAFNLKAAIEYQLKNMKGAQEALTDMPPRSEEELDPVTLHNQALMNMDTKPSEGFQKLAFLLQQPSFPHVTFGNLLLLHCKHEYFDLAADVLAENAHLTYKFLSPYMYEFLDALLTCQTAPEEAFRMFDEMSSKLTEQLRKLAKQVLQEARLNRDDEAQKKVLQDYDLMQEKYVVVLMAQAKIYWNHAHFPMVEKIFRKSVEFCNNNDTWKLNVAHVLFMQNKYKEAIGFYEPIVKKHYNNILSVSAVVLANLCVSYIMTSQNEEAEELMRKIEKEEEQISYDDPEQKVFHHCIVNLVIGTLYCAKGNYDFGITRVIKSLEPYSKKVGPFLGLKILFFQILSNSLNMTQLDKVVLICVCVCYGKEVPALIEQPLEELHVHIGKNTVTYEARLLKALFYEVISWNK
uniref:Tetratricopeptide repeat protein 30 n=1 Tax=Nothobranchius furzeri TaxID=105023 RepID=A0A8C6NYG0_NOTFU